MMDPPDGRFRGPLPAHADTGLRRQRSLAAPAGGLAWAFVAGGASTPPLTLRGPASEGSLGCAAEVLHAADFEVTSTEDWVVGEVRVLAGESGTTREFVEAQRVDGGQFLEVFGVGLPFGSRNAPAPHPPPNREQGKAERRDRGGGFHDLGSVFPRRRALTPLAPH